jgi:succinate-semialdehyde dehydrogenase / glutarate-semialdehyde dehydrogenase
LAEAATRAVLASAHSNEREEFMSDYAVVNPATGETVKEYPTISDDDLRDAIGRADKAVREWSASTTVEERAQLVRRVGEIHAEQRERLAEIIVREMGKPVEQALAELDFCAAIYEYYADNAPKLLADEEIELLDGDGSAIIRRSSQGVLLGIMPWNFPYYQVARFAGPNLAIGNTILLKHAPQCPESAEAMEQIYHEAGFPPDAYINIYATNQQVETVIGDPRVRGVSLTGSERAGAAVAEIAGRNLKKVVLELGGSDPFILLSTDDLDTAVENAVAARVDNTGQSCNAAKRFIVVDELYDDFVEKLKEKMGASKTGDPAAEDTALGPLSSATAADILEDQLKRAIDNGAEVVIGGGRDGNYIEPTILAGIKPGDEASQEEFFGPVAQVYRVGSEEEAVELANQTPFGLGSYVMSTDKDQAERVANQIEAGMVYVNLVLADSPELPFGGFKRSGFGRELGTIGADEFVNKKLIRSA